MPLKEYKEKRDFGKTSEPKEGVEKRGSGVPIFVVQKHKAARLH